MGTMTERAVATRTLKEFAVTTAFDQVHLDIGDTRYFVYPEKAVEVADALRSAAATLRPLQPTIRIHKCLVSKDTSGMIELQIAGMQYVLSPECARELANSLMRVAKEA